MLMAWCISHIIAYWTVSLSLALLSLANSSLSQTLGPSTPPGSIFEPQLAQSLLRDEDIEIGTCTETPLGCCWHICVPLATMAPHSSTLAWKIPWMEQPGGLQSMGSLRVGHDCLVNLTQLLCYMWFLTQSKCQSWLLTNPNVVNSSSAAPLATSKHLSDQVRRPTVWGFYSSCYLVFVTSCSAVQSTFYFWKSSHHWIISRFHSGNCMYSLFC